MITLNYFYNGFVGQMQTVKFDTEEELQAFLKDEKNDINKITMTIIRGNYMAKYRSGDITVEFHHIKTEIGRSEYQIMIRLENEDEIGVLELGDYTCPANWTDEKIAEDLVGWAVDKHEHIFDDVEHDEENSEQENRYIVEKVI